MSDKQGGYLVSIKSPEMQAMLTLAKERNIYAEQAWSSITHLLDLYPKENELYQHCVSIYSMLNLIRMRTIGELELAKIEYDAAPTDHEAVNKFWEEMTKNVHKS